MKKAKQYLLHILVVATILGSSRSDAAEWYVRWRSLTKHLGTHSTCGSELKPLLSEHVNEALIDVVAAKWLGENGTTVPEVCNSNVQITSETSLARSSSKVCLNPHSGDEVHFLKSYYRQMNIAGEVKVAGAIPAIMNYQDSTTVTQRGYFEQPYTPVITSGPSQAELADTVHRLAIQQGWSYIVILTEAEAGAMTLSQQLHNLAERDKKVCFPLTITFNSGNATKAAKSLREFAYPTMTRLTVVYAGSGTPFLDLWDLITGIDLSYTDHEKRYQFVLVGNAFGSFYKATDTVRKRHFGLGTIFVFPGIIDPNPRTDPVAKFIHNISNSIESMGEFSSLRDTWSRLQSLKNSTNALCNSWTDFNSLCYIQALMYDYQLLSLVPLVSTFPPGTTPDLSTTAKVEALLPKTATLSDLRPTVPFLDAFLNENYTTYSLSKGLRHRDLGFWQPIVKVYQSQLTSSSEATLVKLGQLVVKQAGTVDQSYQWELKRTPVLYQFTGGNPDSIPSIATNSHSVCPSSCPKCVSLKGGKQHVEYKHGDIYFGAILPIFDHGTDLYQCTDGTFYTDISEWSSAFRFVVDVTNWASQGTTTTPPPGMDPSLVDNQFLLGIRDLLSKIQSGHTKKLSLGYVVLDSCYAAPYLTNKLSLLLDGKLEPLTGLNYTKFVGFVGDLSSTQTMAASQVLKQYSIPIISHSATSTALSDVFQYPFTMRTISSDNEIVEAMVTIIKHYNVDLITVVNTPNAYGISLRDAMSRIASRDGICIAEELVFDCGISDDSCKRSLALQMRNAETRYVAFLSDGSDLRNFLNYSQVENDLEFITLFATEALDVSTFSGKNNLGIGTTMVQLLSAPRPAFLKFLNYTLTRMPDNSNKISQWDRLYFETLNQCYLPDSFIRSSVYKQRCESSIVESRQVTQLESRSVFLMTATQTLILGTLTAINYLCLVVTPDPACPAFFKGDGDTMLQRANLIMYGQVTATGTTAQRFSGTFDGVEWSFQKIFENRMGRPQMRLMQFRKLGSANYGFVPFGEFDGMNSSEFTASAKELYQQERQVTSSLVKVCRTAVECNNPKCVNRINSAGTCSSPGGCNQGSGSSLLGLLGLLFIPGVVIGFLLFWFLGRLLVQKPQAAEDAEYAYPDGSHVRTETPVPAGRVSYYCNPVDEEDDAHTLHNEEQEQQQQQQQEQLRQEQQLPPSPPLSPPQAKQRSMNREGNSGET